MRVLYVATDLRDADILQQEVRRSTPDLAFDMCVGLAALRARQDQPSTHDVLLMDGGLPEAEQLQLIHYIRVRQLALPIIVLAPANGAAPSAALSAGADDFLVRGPKSAERLAPALRLSVERYRTLANTLRENEKLKRSEARLRLIIEALPTGVLLLDQAGKVLAMNAAGVQYFGSVSPQDIVGRQFATMIPVEDQPGLREFLEKVGSGEEASLQFSSLAYDEAPQVFNLRGLCIQRDQNGQNAVLGVIERVPVAPSGQHTWNADFDLGVGSLPSPMLDIEPGPSLDSAMSELLAPGMPSRAVDLESRRQAAESRASLAEAELASLQAAVEEAEGQQSAAAERLQEIESRSVTIVAERDSLRQALMQAEAQLADAQEQATQAGGRVRELETALDGQKRIADENQRIADERAQVGAQAGEERSALAGALDTTRADLAAAAAQLVVARQATDDLRATVASKETALAQKEVELAQQVARLDDLQAELRRRDARLDEQHAEVMKRDTRLEEVKAELTQHVTRAQAQLADLADRDGAMATQTAHYLEERAALEAQLAEAEAQLANAQAAIAERDAAIQAHVAALEEQRGTLGAQIAQADAQTGIHQAALVDRDARIQAQATQLAEQRLALDAHVARLDEQGIALRARDAVIGEKANELAERAARLAEASARAASLDEVRGALERAREELTESRAELVTMSRTLAAQREAQEQLQAALTQKEGEALDTERVAHARIAELEQEIRSLSQRLRELLEQAAKDSSVSARGLMADPARRGSERLGRLAAAMAGDLHAAVGTAGDAVKALVAASGAHGSAGTGGTVVRDAAEHALDTLVRCGELARHLLRLSARYMGQSPHVDLAKVVRQQDALLRYLAGPDVELHVELTPGLVSSDFDTQDLSHVLSSLIVAARDALPLGGAIRVTTSSQPVETHEAPRGERARPLVLSVNAKGYGIRPVSSTTCEEVTERCGGVLTTVIEPNVSWTLIAMLPGGLAEDVEAEHEAEVREDLTRSA